MTWYVALIGIFTILVTLLLMPYLFRNLKAMEGESPKAAFICKKKTDDVS